MKIAKEDLWLPADMWIVTTNSTLTKSGALVMGKGAALQAKQRFPYIDDICGCQIKQEGLVLKTYGLLVILPNFGIFQVKKHWSERASLDLIRRSATDLRYLAQDAPYYKFRMNFPGIGAGGLTRDQVEPLLQDLPDNVIICMR